MSAVDIRFDGRMRSMTLPPCHLEIARRPQGSAMDRPPRVDPAPLASAVEGAERLLVIVNDAYRPTPTGELLAALDPLLSTPSEVRLIVATGMHPAPPDAFLAGLAKRISRHVDVTVHDARAPGTDFGALADGSPLELNPWFEWAECVLLLGSVEPHFFAGYTGGAKQILPGLATRATIEANHRHAASLDCRPCRIAGNPVAAGIREVAERFGARMVSLQVVAGPDGWEAFAGTEQTTFAQATRRCRETAELHWTEPLDAVIAVVDPPLDRNLYQLQKGFENHLWALRPGGNLLLVSACREGVGNDFFLPLAQRYPRWQQLPPWEEQPYSLGLHKLYRMARARERAGLHLYSSLPDDLVRSFYFEPVPDLDAWLATHISAGMHVGVVHDAAGRVSHADFPGDL